MREIKIKITFVYKNLLKSFKFLFNFLIFTSLLSGFYGCSSQTGKTAKAATALKVWHWMTDREPAFQELAKIYESKTGIRVNFELYAPSDAYTQKVRAAVQGNTLPDVFGILGEKRDFAAFINSGCIFDLTVYMQQSEGEWKNWFFKKALEVNEFPENNRYGIKPGIYGVPIDVMTIQMLYNKDLLKEIGVNPDRPPVKFSDFLALGKKIKEAKLQGLVSGWGELWMIDCFANNYAFNIMGKDKVLATIRGDVPYTDADWIKVLTIFKDLKEAGLLADGIVTMVNKTAEQVFANSKAVFAFNGSWCVNVYKGMNPELNYAAMLPPKFSDQYPMSIWGGAGSSFMVNAHSKNKEEAVKFLQWFTDKDQQVFLAETTHNLPANKHSIDKIPEILAQFSDDIDLSTHPNTWGISEYPAVIEAWNKGIQLIILGEKTPEKVAAEVQEVKKRELAKKR